MVGMPLCVSIGLALCQPNVVSDEDITEQKHYSELEENEVYEIMEGVLAPTTYGRSIINLENILDTYKYVEGYYEYMKEQERLEQEQIAKEQQRMEEELKLQEWLDSFDRQNYRQTYYSVIENKEQKLGSGHTYLSEDIKNISNIMHYNDKEYGWLPIYAINMNEVINSGQNEGGTWNLFGSIIELKRGEDTWMGIVLDSCGKCRYEPKIDLWVYNNQIDLDVSGIDWRIVRYGY